MRRSSPSSCSSSSSSCVVVDCEPMMAGNAIRDMPKKPRAKRVRRKCRDDFQNASGGSPTNPARRSSIFRGVTRHRCTGRFEAHLWDRCSWNIVQKKKGKQVYLGAYDDEEAAARTYDLAALKYWGPDTILNFPMDTYKKELEEMQNVSKEEYLASLRRRSSGFSRGVSKYRGVARHHHNGRWEARIGRVHGNKYLYLGTYDTQEEAAAAYDIAALQYRGPNAVTNFDMSNYADGLKSIGVHPNLSHWKKEPDSQKSQAITESQEPNLKLAPVPSPQWSTPYSHDDDHISTCLIDPVDQMLQIPWSFCCADIGHNPLPVLGSGGESLPDPFEDRGFEDDIDMIFEVGDMNGHGDEGEGVGEVILSCDIRESSSSPALSTTTYVSCPPLCLTNWEIP